MTKMDLSLSADELDRFLAEQRTVRLATASPDSRPHVVPLWFVWVDGTMFMNSTLGNLTIRNIQKNPIATGSIDDGFAYNELKGVLVQGRVEWAEQAPRLETVMHRWSEKYMGGNPLPYNKWKKRVWLRLVPQQLTSWDFGKIEERKASQGE